MRHKEKKAAHTVTVIDVAREAGVSSATVSRVLSGKENVKPETYQKVMQAMTQLGYVVNQHARSLGEGHSHLLGLLLSDIHGYTGEIVIGIDYEISQTPYDLLLYTTHRRKTREEIYIAKLTRGLTAGLILMTKDAEKYLEPLRQQRFPHVLITQGVNAEKLSPSVQVDSIQGGYDATSYLIELGHRRIGFITGAQDSPDAIDRLDAYKRALADHGITYDEKLVYPGNFDHAGGYNGMLALLGLEQPPTAIFSSNDHSALGVMDAARQHGLRIPEDLSLMGYDDLQEDWRDYPALTTVRQPLREMGQVAVRQLLKYVKEPERPVEHLKLPTKIIIRETCSAPANPERGPSLSGRVVQQNRQRR